MHLQAKMQEVNSLQCSDLHVHLAAEGPSLWPEAPGAAQAEQPCLLQIWARQRATD